MLDPGVLEGPGDVFDDEDKETVGRQELRSLAAQFERFGILFSAIESGAVSLSIGEFERLPATFHEAWNIFRRARRQYSEKKAANDRKIASP